MSVNLEETVFYSYELNREQKIFFLYDKTIGVKNMDCNLLFVQDGEDYLELGNLKEQFEDLLKIDRELFEKIVMILVPPGTSHERYQFYHSEGERHHDYQRFFSKELLPKAQEFFEQNGKRLQRKGMLGDSLGASVSLSIALQYPLQWTHILLQSAAVTETLIKQVKEKDLSSWHVYQVYGKHEDGFQSQISKKTLNITSSNRKLADAFLNAKANLTYFEEDERHLWSFWKRDLKRALTYFAEK
ncbi:alpha/beta hydrolase [Pseudalkalibacillus decolorationis]|uniref:alpha/beta hydrolase n=1 Tax=Pseudalkalibacillus decolorationis TaxID=163879 RepID=UPI00214962D0|nr:alpha/beta hydrolase-fold protein [Pseudalkalibacillus decolorationis]